MKKSVIILLSFALACLVFAGCSSKGSSTQADPSKKAPSKNFNKTGFPIVNKPIKLTMFAKRSPANGPYKDMTVFKTYAKKTNVHFKFNDVPQASFADKKNLVLSSKNIPDIFYKASISPANVIKYGTSGELIPLEGLIQKYAPNIQAIFKKYPVVKQAITAPDGHIYALSSVISPLVARTEKIWLNQKMLNGVHMNAPKTTDDLYQLLKAFKAKYPSKIPMSASTVANLIYKFCGSWGLDNQMAYYIKINNGKVNIWLTDDRFKEELMYLHKLYKNNLIDHKIITQTRAQYIAKMQTGKVGLFFNQNSRPFAQVSDQYAGIAPVKGPHGDQTYVASPLPRDFGEFAISSTNKHPAASIRWLDYFFSKKGSIFFRYGVKGKTYHDENGKPVIDPKVLKLPKGIGSITPFPGGSSPQWVNDQNDGAIANTRDKAAAAKLKPYVPDKVYSPPMFKLSTAKEVNDLETDINSFVKQATAKFISGDRSFDTWDKYKSQLKQMGLPKLEEYYQTAYDRQYK